VIGLSVAVGRFVEALFWAILRVAGGVAAIAVLTALGLAAAWAIARKLWRMRAARPKER
jgi:nucleoside recognition membrane protein YjiH